MYIDKLFDDSLPAINWDDLIGSGISCYCYSTQDENIYFKAFLQKREAEVAHDAQQEASYVDIAPLVYSPVLKVPVPVNTRRLTNRTAIWGFFTEKVEVDKNSNKSDFNRFVFDRMKSFIPLVEEFFKARWYDNHEGNVGIKTFKGKRRLVCIDFGENGFVSAYPYDDRQYTFKFV